MRGWSISEILKMAAEAKTNEEKQAVLLKHDSVALRTILKHMLCPSVKYHADLPPGETPYTPSKFDEQGRLFSEIRRLYLFVADEPRSAHLKASKRQMLWIELLETISPEDAKLLDSVKDKKIPYKGLTKALVKKTFPDLIED